MKNIKSILIIVLISIFVGSLHFVIGPNYKGIFKPFIGGYLIDILLPLNMYLLYQIALRKHLSVKIARTLGSSAVLLFAFIIEMCQSQGIPLFGSTFDPLDFVMYALGILLGLSIDFFLIDRFENEMAV